MTIANHAGMLIAPRINGTADLINPATGRWINLPSVRSAKWHATVWSRLASRLTLDEIETYVARMEHTYPHLGELQ